MRFIPWSQLEPSEVPVAEPAPVKKEKVRARKKDLSDEAFDNITASLEITRTSLEKIAPDVFYDQLISKVYGARDVVSREQSDMFMTIMRSKNLFKKWKDLWAHSGGTYLAIIEFLELANNFLHIHPFIDLQKIDVEDIFPAPRDPYYSRFLADLVLFASKHLEKDPQGLNSIGANMTPEEKDFIPAFITICYIYFSTIFYTMRFINPSMIDTWAEVFELDTTDSPETMREACQCWWDDPKKSTS